MLQLPMVLAALTAGAAAATVIGRSQAGRGRLRRQQLDSAARSAARGRPAQPGVSLFFRRLISMLPTVGRRVDRRPAPLIVVAGVAAAVVGGPALGAVAAVLATVLAARRRRSRRRAAEERDRAEATRACRVLAAELRAGRPPGHALRVAGRDAIGPVGFALRRVATTVHLSGDVPAALAAPAGEAAITGGAAAALRRLGACWVLSARTGANLAVSVELLAEGLRAEERTRRELAAMLAGSRASALLLAGLPLLGIGMAAVLGAQPLHLLLHTLGGVLALCAGALLDVAGLVWTDHLVDRVQDRLP